MNTVQDLDGVIKQFRDSVMPRIVVLVDMIATGTDIMLMSVIDQAYNEEALMDDASPADATLKAVRSGTVRSGSR